MTQRPLSPEAAGQSARVAPDWVVGEMPPGYHTRLAEIQRLSEDLHAMDPFGRLLWEAGPRLTEAVRDVFVALRFEAVLMPGHAASGVLVKLDARRLLLHVAATEDIIKKKSEELAHVFQMLHESAEDSDRVVLVANNDLMTRPADRTDGIEPEALSFLRRMGANFLASPTLFRLWTVALHDQERARGYVERLHALDGGIFLPPSP
jgi:hypothetical protein